MSKVIKNVFEVKPEKVEEFNDMNYYTQYQTNLKDPEDVTLDLGNIQNNYNTELTLLTVSAAPMEKSKSEENISFHFGNNPNQVERNLLSRKRSRTGTEKAPKQKKDANENEMSKHPENLSMISRKKNIKNDPLTKNDGPNEKNEFDQNRKCPPRRKPHIKIRLIFDKKKLKKKKNEKLYLNVLENNNT